MKYRLLGKSGLRVSELALGTMSFGDIGDLAVDETECRKIFDTYVEAGGNFVDTADCYMGGQSEARIGRFIAERRDRFVIGTKYTFSRNGEDPNAGGNHRKNLNVAVEASLRRLGTDYIDLYHVHAPDGMTPIDEVLRALDDAVRAGKILYVGISNAPAWLVAHSNTLADLKGWSRFVGMQVRYSLADRAAERELLPMAGFFGIGVTAYAPLGGGLLTGKYGRDTSKHPENGRLSRSAFGKAWLQERHLKIAEALLRVTNGTGKTPAQVALAWLRQRPERAIPIIGAMNVAQLRENIGCLDVHLDAEKITELNRASLMPLGYPHDYLREPLTRALLFGKTAGALEDLR